MINRLLIRMHRPAWTRPDERCDFRRGRRAKAISRLLSCLGIFLFLGPAHALMLGTTEVPKEKIIVYLLIGHSNMAGVDIRNSDGATNPRAWTYPWFNDKKWTLAKETPGRDENGLSGRGEGGPGMPFVKAMAAAFPQFYFGLVSNASVSCTLRGENEGHNGSGMPADSNRYWKGAVLYDEIVKAAKEVQKDVTLGGVLCMLGSVEATRTSEAICRAFSDDAAQMVKDLRADLRLPNLPFIMGEYEAGATGVFATTRNWPGIVDQQIKLIPSKLPNSATVNSVGIQMRDDHHFTATVGQQEWARRAVEVIKAKNWGPTGVGSVVRLQGRLESGKTRLQADYRHGRLLLLPEPGPSLLRGGRNAYLADGKELILLRTVRP